ncbi:DUF885 family protein [Novosphingobium sp. TH158]|uniref:DUF885 domain-containing protein n=1 Tax=Novosphingobium sp. TH158 TaxID=2067455 RepID=UPI000C7C1E3B|nr:DUF885 domain-containing protein [Novosphingobium sp. TH158]PLK25562.1 DUF885 domain-containing protein [Novosphingobium sp. TH158]
MSNQSLTRRQALGGIAAASAAFTLPASALAAPKATVQARATKLLDDIAWGLLKLSPEGATSLGIDTGAHAALRSQLEDRSPAGVKARADLLRSSLRQVSAIPVNKVDASTRTSLAVVTSAFRTALDGFALPYGDVAIGGWRNTPYVVIQNVGAYLDTPRFLDGDHPVRNAEDAEAYLKRLSSMGSVLDGELERLKDAGSKGLVAPDFLLDKAIAQMERSIADAGSGNSGMVQSLVSRTRMFPGDWEKRAQGMVSASVLPALQRQLEELKKQRTRATSEAGMLHRPHGEEWYAWGLRASTTTRLSPKEIHEIGKAQLAELQARMEPILQKLGHTRGTVGERMKALGEAPEYQFPNNDEGRREIIKLMEDKIAFIRGKMPLAFRKVMPGRIEIRRLPPAEEAGAPNAYGGAGSIDGTIPGKVWVNLSSTDRHSRFSVPDLVFHEGIPGHVWQGEYSNQLPLIRSLLAFNAYSEGWALYAQQLADELGAYDDDPVGRLGYLQGIAFRCCRLVVDTGIHAMGWSRDKALHWFAEANGSGLAELAPEIDRYCSWPGQACGYKMGHTEINRQRDRARGALGGKYDLRDFNQAVVDGGNVPLDVLALNVDRYVAGARA